jgi:sterol desaturase/sphingolipid hydroxylase (fatty acid hydroxylase superfamily)
MNALGDVFVTALVSTVTLTLVVYPFETLRPADAKQRLRDRLTNYLYLPVSLACVIALQMALGPWNGWLTHSAQGGVLPNIHGGRLLLSFAFVLAWDVWQYWIHRWQHTSALLWATHRFHHSDTALNSSSQARHHPLSHVVYAVTYAPIILLFGAFSPPLLLSIAMFRVWGFVNHANIRIGFGPAAIILASPQWHRIHHSADPKHRDVNFATFFPFIDWLFGTYYRPARDEYPATGLTDDLRSDDVSRATLGRLGEGGAV